MVNEPYKSTDAERSSEKLQTTQRVPNIMNVHSVETALEGW